LVSLGFLFLVFLGPSPVTLLSVEDVASAFSVVDFFCLAFVGVVVPSELAGVSSFVVVSGSAAFFSLPFFVVDVEEGEVMSSSEAVCSSFVVARVALCFCLGVLGGVVLLVVSVVDWSLSPEVFFLANFLAFGLVEVQNQRCLEYTGVLLTSKGRKEQSP